MRIVLVRPRDPNNIGAAARAMANFGFADLVVVAPHPPVWEEVRSAIGADDVIASARIVPTLADAIAGCRFVAGTTGDEGRRLGRVATPRELFADVDAYRGDVALVFGNEKHGLTNDDLELCHVTVRVPTTPAQPSLNLAHAVAICCYEAAGREPRESRQPPRRGTAGATSGEIESFLDALAGSPSMCERPPQLRAGAVRRLRALLLRARVTRAELALLHGLIDRT